MEHSPFWVASSQSVTDKMYLIVIVFLICKLSKTFLRRSTCYVKLPIHTKATL